MSKTSNRITDTIFPKDLPNGLFISLIIACLLLGLASLRHGTDLQGWLNVIENWLLMLLILPTATATVAYYRLNIVIQPSS